MKRQNDRQVKRSSRREFLARSGQVVAGSVLAGGLLSRAYAGEDSTVRIALVGCGGRGSGAAGKAILESTGLYKDVELLLDLAGQDRVIKGRLK